MSRRNSGFPRIVFGISPLGGSFKDPSDGTVSGVPLFYDSHTDQYQSEQAIEEQNDRETSIELGQRWIDDDEFRSKAGFIKA